MKIKIGPSFLIACSSLFLLAACTTFHQLDKGLQTLTDKGDIQTAFDVLGYPSDKQYFEGNTIYVWSVRRTGTTYAPTTSYTTGSIGSTPMYATTSSSRAVPYNYNCTIKLTDDGFGRIKRWEYDGNIAGCKNYIGRLNRYRSKAPAKKTASYPELF